MSKLTSLTDINDTVLGTLKSIRNFLHENIGLFGHPDSGDTKNAWLEIESADYAIDLLKANDLALAPYLVHLAALRASLQVLVKKNPWLDEQRAVYPAEAEAFAYNFRAQYKNIMKPAIFPNNEPVVALKRPDHGGEGR